MRLAIIRTQTKKLGILLNFLALKNAPLASYKEFCYNETII